MAQHRRRIAEPFHLVQPMADIENALALVAQPLQRHEQLVSLLRRQHGCRLVENDELRLLQKAADDFNALALADRQVADQRLRVQRQAIGLRHRPRLLGDLRNRRCLVERQRDVLGGGQGFEQREMLEHHADAELARGGGVGNCDLAALPEDIARGRLQRAEQHFHQSRFARAVLAEQRMDFALADAEADIVVRLERSKNLGDAADPQQFVFARRRIPVRHCPLPDPVNLMSLRANVERGDCHADY